MTTTPLIRPLDPQPPDWWELVGVTPLFWVVEFRALGVSMYRNLNLTPLEIEGHEINVMRLHDYWNKDRLCRAWAETDCELDAFVDWVRETLRQWNTDNPNHPWDSNPWVVVLTGKTP